MAMAERSLQTLGSLAVSSVRRDPAPLVRQQHTVIIDAAIHQAGSDRITHGLRAFSRILNASSLADRGDRPPRLRVLPACSLQGDDKLADTGETIGRQSKVLAAEPSPIRRQLDKAMRDPSLHQTGGRGILQGPLQAGWVLDAGAPADHAGPSPELRSLPTGDMKRSNEFCGARQAVGHIA
jgi:hypothetical protein